MKKLAIVFGIVIALICSSIVVQADPIKRAERQKKKTERYLKKFPNKHTKYQKEKMVLLLTTVGVVTFLTVQSMMEEGIMKKPWPK